ncbi:LCP family protein required for cell wall assembly [Mycolicibacterium sp. BK556]|uniref:LCP family protein n=1 Tax=unclassified Mycolicibacterium TaxID=2636767 RepID=UPI0016158261|nr:MULTISPECIES: LCP family protein [unclassified Mycolicibacterium]MBB3601717.1 LCP family protein required for cell wall assembly [Mycolicibacterium sp. BK556]MBB3631469.1 LCP family protein required for cell wall assembly [Mycolicibacterium sp. BK607]
MDPSPPPRAAAAGNRHGRHRERRGTGRRAWKAVTRSVVGLASVVVLMLTGLAYSQAHGLLSGITVSQALGSDEPRSSGGAMNILLIGLDSRKDQEGNELPDEVLDKLHAGDSDAGGYNTNTLILVHISADDHVVAFSIPRDDYVAVSGIKGYSHIKIKEAYGLTKFQTEQKLVDEGIGDRAELERAGREAGRKATIRAVRNLTGQPIDYFAEVNLASFYHLADSLGGVDVCLNHAVHDDYSGANFPAGPQRLNAEQALAFVRQRHGLENGDLDRTHRQQAFLLSVSRELQQSGSFTDLDKFKRLMDVARQDIVLSQGWGEDQFRRMAALAGGNVEFRTLPVVRYDNINGQDVNIVDPSKIRAEIARAIGGDSATATTTAAPQPIPPPNPQTVISIVNASDTSGLASQAASLLGKHDFTVDEVRDRESGEPIDTVITYGPGGQTDAQSVATLLGVENAPQATSALAADHVRVVLGQGYDVPTEQPETQDVSVTSTTKKWSEMTITPTPDQGAPIDGGKVPCVN